MSVAASVETAGSAARAAAPRRGAGLGRTAGSALRAQEALRRRPVASIADVCRWAGLTHPTAGVALDRLQEVGVVRELTGRKRNRVFAYEGYLRILDGLAPAPPGHDSGGVTASR